jgi:hypothetical protein
MKKFPVLVLVAAALAFPAAQANAASPATPTIAQFRALKKQVKTLQSQMKNLQTQAKDLNAFANGLIPLLACQDVVVADALQGTWNVIDQISAATQAGKTYFGTQTPITDSSSCTNVRVTRSSGIPPTVAIFSSLVTLLTT